MQPARVRIVDVRSTMALVVCFVDDVEAEAVIKLIKMWRIRVVACPDRIHIMFLHQGQILPKLWDADRKAGDRIAVMSVCSVKFNFCTIDVEHTICRMDFPDTDLLID